MTWIYWYVTIFGLLHHALAKSNEDWGTNAPGDYSLDYEYEDSVIRGSKCKDALPNCDAVANPAVCCVAKPLANVSCQRACKFCHDINSIPVPGIGSMPGGGGIGVPGAPTPPTVQNDPCNPGSAPGISGGNEVGGGAGTPPGLG